MKKLLKNILLIASLLLIAASCEKSPTRHENLSGIPILITATEVGGTKALLDAESFATYGNELQIYDYYTPSEGSATPTPYFYIEDTVRSNGSSWPFVTGNNKPGKYEWTTDGVHKFFGWLVKDANFDNSETEDDDESIYAGTFFGKGFGLTDQTLTIPTTTLTQTETPQFDFMYSNIETRDLDTNPNFGPVDMEFKHLFTAFKVTAANNSSNYIKFKSITFNNLKNSRSATINFSGEHPAIDYQDVTTSGEFIYSKNVELGSTAEPISSGYTMMWPHSKEDLTDVTVTVEYAYKEKEIDNYTDADPLTVSLKDITPWSAGTKNTLNLMFRDKEIKVTCIVKDWDIVNENLEFSDQVFATMPLTWEPRTVEHDDVPHGNVILISDNSIVAVCKFRIQSPAGATWTASLIPVEGRSDAFEIMDGTKYGAVGTDSEIRIRVINQQPIAPRNAVKLRITIQTADGRTIVADLMPDATNEEVTEYTIIQNLING